MLVSFLTRFAGEIKKSGTRRMEQKKSQDAGKKAGKLFREPQNVRNISQKRRFSGKRREFAGNSEKALHSTVNKTLSAVWCEMQLMRREFAGNFIQHDSDMPLVEKWPARRLEIRMWKKY
jgi:hypothetical protein